MATTQQPAATTLRVARSFRAAPERVFHAWTAKEELDRWSAPGPVRASTEVDLRVGGRYRIVMTDPQGKVFAVSGTYREVDPPRRLVYTWQWEDQPGFPETVVTVEFAARADGGTDVTLLHDGLPSDDSRAKHEHGWNGCLDNLGPVVE